MIFRNPDTLKSLIDIGNSVSVEVANILLLRAQSKNPIAIPTDCNAIIFEILSKPVVSRGFMKQALLLEVVPVKELGESAIII